MKVTVLLALALSLVPLNAQAISRFDSQSMTCDRVQSVLRSQGAAILRYRSPNNHPMHDRFVENAGNCSTKHTRVASVPTSDTQSCQVLRCTSRAHHGR